MVSQAHRTDGATATYQPSARTNHAAVVEAVKRHLAETGRGATIAELHPLTGISISQIRVIADILYQRGVLGWTWDAGLRLVPATEPPDLDRCAIAGCAEAVKATARLTYRFCEGHLRRQQAATRNASLAQRRSVLDQPGELTLAYVDYLTERVFTLRATVESTQGFPDTDGELDRLLEAARNDGAQIVMTGWFRQ